MSGSDSGITNAIGNIPVAGIPVVAPITIRDEVHTGTELYHMVDRFFGGGLTAGQLHGELEPVCSDGGAGKAQLEHIRSVLNSASHYTGTTLPTTLNKILTNLTEAYQGAASSKIQTQFQKANTLLSQLSPSFTTLASGINSTQDTLKPAWDVVKNYSRLHADESNISSLNPFGGGDSDDDKAEKAWNTASSGLQGIGSQMASTNPNGTSMIQSTPYTPPNSTNPQSTIPNPGSTGPGPGSFTPGGAQPGNYHPGNFHPGTFHPGTPGGPGPGYTPGGPGGPGPGYGPGGYSPGGYSPGGPGPGPGPGSGLDTGSDLSSAGPGGPGPGYAGPGPGFGGDSGGLSGAGTGAGTGAGSAAGAAGGGGAAGGLGAVPLGGRGGAGGGGGDSERERSTWLTEDDDVWGDSDAPDGVIS